MDQTGMNIAVPRIADAFNASIPTVQWVVLGYILAISTVMLPVARLSDSIGRVRLYVAGFIIFALGGMAAGLVPNLGAVIALKMFQGVGTAMTTVTGMAIVTTTFPAAERGKAIGLMTTTVGVGAIAGPAIGGVLIDLWGWRAIFVIAGPLGMLSALVGGVVLRGSGGRAVAGASLRSFDYLGSVLSTAALAMFLVTMSFGYRFGWTSPVILGAFVGVVVLAVLLIRREQRAVEPILPLELFRRPAFSLGAIVNFLSFMSTTAIFFLLPFFLQEVQGRSPGQTGLVMITTAVCMMVISPLAGRFSDKIGTKPFVVTGLTFLTTGFLLASRLDAESSLELVLVTLIFSGMGMGSFFSPNSSSILSSIERERYAVGAAFLNLLRTAGNITGIAIATTVVTTVMAAEGFEPTLANVGDAGSDGVREAFARGLSYAFLLSAAYTSIALLISIKRANVR
jgi:EmrB/QacA subfamily drug resistance transporter